MENLELVLHPITVERLVYIFEQLPLNVADIEGAHFFVDEKDGDTIVFLSNV